MKSLEVLVPEPIEPRLVQVEQRQGLAQLFADDQEAFIGHRCRRLGGKPLPPGVAREVLVFLDEVPVGDVLDTVHADAVDVEIVHPAEERGLHQLAGRDRTSALGRRSDRSPRRPRHSGTGCCRSRRGNRLPAGIARVRIGRMVLGLRIKKSFVAAARYAWVRAKAITTSTRKRSPRAWQAAIRARRSRLGVGHE